jgi:hypothetical protein
VSGQLNDPAALPQGKRLGGLQNWSGLGGEEKNSQPLPGLEPPIMQSVAQRCTTELCQPLGTPLRFYFNLVWDTLTRTI